jgi:aerobic C4-dicarboxylate transport protein
MVSVYVTMGIFVFLVLGLVMRSCGEKITTFLNYIKARVIDC